MKNAEKWSPSIFTWNQNRLSVNRSHVRPSSWLPNSLIASTFNELIPKYCKGKLLDLGCGKVPYYELYRQYTTETTCADWGNSAHGMSYLDIEQDLNQPLQLPDEEYDTILLSDVLEHVAETDRVLNEIYRVLKPGGFLILSVPFLYRLHEVPYDMYRLTCFGLKHRLERAGLQVEDIVVHGGWSAVMVDLFSKRVVTLPVAGKFIVTLVQTLAVPLFQRRNSAPKNRDLSNPYPLGYVCVACKPLLQKQS